jgi:hypothetical protein
VSFPLDVPKALFQRKSHKDPLNGGMGGNHRLSGNVAKRKYLSYTGNPKRFIGYSANNPVIIPTELFQLACFVVEMM